MTAAVRRLARRLAVAACDAADRLRAAAEAERTRRTVARFARCGARPRIAAGVAIHRPEEVRAGDDLRIGAGGRLMAAGGLEIGDNVVLSRDVTIYCSDHAFGGDEPLPFGPGRTSGGTVRIGDHVWIGAHVRVLPGVTIGEGAILGMGAVVARDVPPRAIVGQPAFRILGERDAGDFAAAVDRWRAGRPSAVEPPRPRA